MKFIRVSKKHPCPICHKPDYCGVSNDRKVAVCMRIKSDRRTRNNGYLHKLDYDSILSEPSISSRFSFNTPFNPNTGKDLPLDSLSACSTAEHRDEVYSKLLREHLVLADEHLSSLLERGLSLAEIEYNGYRSIPTVPYALNTARALSLYDLEGVPGFYWKAGWRIVIGDSGFYIPVKDHLSRIQALLIRRDDGKPKYIWLSSAYKEKGASSGAPIHYRNVNLIRASGEAIITEGALKTDCIAFMEQAGCLGLPGVSGWPEGFGRLLREQIPELKNIIIAFDMDWREKEQVKRALLKLMRELTRADFKVRVRTWEGGKGYDDHLRMSI